MPTVTHQPLRTPGLATNRTSERDAEGALQLGRSRPVIAVVTDYDNFGAIFSRRQGGLLRLRGGGPINLSVKYLDGIIATEVRADGFR